MTLIACTIRILSGPTLRCHTSELRNMSHYTGNWAENTVQFPHMLAYGDTKIVKNT